MSVHMAAEFRMYAEECRHMARTNRSDEDKHYWTTLAERWTRCAENAERAAARPSKRAKTRRRPDPIKRKVA